MDSFIALFLAAFGIGCWILGVMKPRRRVWVTVLIIPSVGFLIFYGANILPLIKPQLWDGSPTGVQVGYPTLFAVILGVWASLSHPKESDQDESNRGGGAHA